MSRKRDREPRTVDVQLVEIYEDLANEDESIRLKAAHSLISKVVDRDASNPLDPEQVLGRLFRGLASGRKAARLGFSIAVTEILSQLLGPDQGQKVELSVAQVLDILIARTLPEGGASGQEERDCYLGRLFGVEAVIKSQILFSPASSTADNTRLLDLVYELSKKKSWLREQCGWILYGGLEALASKDPKDSKGFAEAAIERLCAQDLAKTPEGVAIWLTTQTQFPQVQLPKSVWHHRDPLNIKESATLAKVLKEATVSSGSEDPTTTQKLQKGSWSAKLHFVWDILLAHYYRKAVNDTPAETKHRRLTFEEFWIETVDNSLFSASASDERKSWGFLLFSKVFATAPQECISASLFSKNFLRCLINQLASQDRFLHRAATKAVKDMHARIGINPPLASVAISGLVSSDGASNFDRITKTKTVEKLLSQCDSDGLSDAIALFAKLISRPEPQEQKDCESRRQYLADQLLSALRSKKGEQDLHGEWIEQLLNLFVNVAFSPSDKPVIYEGGDPTKPPITSTTRTVFRSRLVSCLNHLLSVSQADKSIFPYFAIRAIRTLESQTGDGQGLFESDENIRKNVRSSWKILDRVQIAEKSAEGKAKAPLRALKLLYSLTLLQVYDGDADAVAVLDELKPCYEAIVRPESQASDVAASEALVEILLSFVSKPSQLFRKLAQEVFGAFASDMTTAALGSLTNVLETKESLKGQQDMFDENMENGEEEDVDGEYEDEDEEMDSDVELVNGDGAESEGESSENEEGSGELSDDEGDGEDDDELAAFDAKLAKALGTKKLGPGMNDDESSDEDMDDEQMMALEPHLTKVFQERRKVSNKKQERKDAKENIVNFKTRVLDLVEIYVKHEHSNPLVLDLLLPLLRLVRTTSAKSISQKASGVVRELVKHCKTKDLASRVNSETVVGLLKEVHGETVREASGVHSKACGQASLLLAKLATTISRDNVDQVLAVYMDTWRQWLLKRDCRVQASFFTDFVNWSTTAAKQLQQ